MGGVNLFGGAKFKFALINPNMSTIRGTRCCVFGCAKRKKIDENKGNLRSDSEGSDDAESAIKRKFSRSSHR